MPGIIQQDVLGLQVTINDIEPVKVFQCAKQLRGVKPASVFIEFAFPLQMVEELSTVHETHHEVQFVGGLEGKFEGDDEWVVDQSENGALREDVSNLSGSRGDVGFSDRLESVYPLSVLLPHLHHFSKRTLADHFEKVEGVDGEGHIPGRLEIDLEVEGTRTGGRSIPLVGSMLLPQERRNGCESELLGEQENHAMDKQYGQARIGGSEK